MKKNNKGITLIALIVTIIVLLILAGITVALLTGDNRKRNSRNCYDSSNGKRRIWKSNNKSITKST